MEVSNGSVKDERFFFFFRLLLLDRSSSVKALGVSLPFSPPNGLGFDFDLLFLTLDLLPADLLEFSLESFRDDRGLSAISFVIVVVAGTASIALCFRIDRFFFKAAAGLGLGASRTDEAKAGGVPALTGTTGF